MGLLVVGLLTGRILGVAGVISGVAYGSTLLAVKSMTEFGVGDNGY